MPASRVSKKPSGNNRQERMNAVSGREEKRHDADKRVGKTTEQTWIKIRNTWHNNVMTPSGTPWQSSPLCHLPALAQRNRQHAFVVTIEKLLRRGKNSEGLDCLVQRLAITWWQWCHSSNFETQIMVNTSQRARLHVFWIPTVHTSHIRHRNRTIVERWV